jgi:BMFP domain-containing protein YqiC
MEEILQITPLELKFRFELRKQIPTSLRLFNPTGEDVAFKVKTTSPKKYCVRPNTGIVSPQGTVEVMVIMQVQKEPPANPAQIKDKFLVQSLPLSETVPENPSPEYLADLFAKEKVGAGKIRETKLKVAYVMANNPPSSVPEDREAEMEEPPQLAAEAPKPAGGSGSDDVDAKFETAMASLAIVTNERNVADSEAKRLRNELSSLQSKVQTLESKSQMATKTAAPTKTASKSKVAGLVVGFSLFHLLITAILAFLLGRYT